MNPTLDEIPSSPSVDYRAGVKALELIVKLVESLSKS